MKKDDINSEDKFSTNEDKVSRNKLKKIIMAIGILGVIAVAWVFGLSDFVSKGESMFTKYTPLQQSVNEDSLDAFEIDTVSSFFDTLTSISIDTILDLDDGRDSTDINSESNGSKDNSIFKVNTSYDKINDSLLTIRDGEYGLINKNDKDLFTQLLLPAESDKIAVVELFKKSNLPYKSTLKLLALASQDILINADTQLSKSVVNIINESDDISNIYIANREGHIVFATYGTKSNGSIKNIISEFELDASIIQIITVNKIQYVSIPVFNIYGKIGFVVISILNKNAI